MERHVPDKKLPKNGAFPRRRTSVSDEKRLQMQSKSSKAFVCLHGRHRTLIHFARLRSELESYCLPPRPSHPPQAAGWEQLMLKLKSSTRIDPTFKIRERRGMSATVKAPEGGDDADSENEDDSSDIYSTWAGAIIDTDSKRYFCYIEGCWTVPGPESGEDDESDWYSDAWIGIDCDNTLGGGTSHNIHKKSDGSYERETYAWYGWYPSWPIVIDNFDVNIGSVVSCYAWVSAKKTKGNFEIYNVTADTHTSFSFSPPDGYSIKFDNAAWMVEDPVGGCLADFSRVVFSDCSARDRNDTNNDDGHKSDEDDDDAVKSLTDVNHLIQMEDEDGSTCTAKITNSANYLYIRYV